MILMMSVHQVILPREAPNPIPLSQSFFFFFFFFFLFFCLFDAIFVWHPLLNGVQIPPRDMQPHAPKSFFLQSEFALFLATITLGPASGFLRLPLIGSGDCYSGQENNSPLACQVAPIRTGDIFWRAFSPPDSPGKRTSIIESFG